MELFKSPSLADQLEDILDREYRLMLAADFVGLGRMLPLKETAFEQLEKSDADLVSLRSLRDKAERNQQMLDCGRRRSCFRLQVNKVLVIQEVVGEI